MGTFINQRNKEEGQGVLEYALILVGVAVVVVAVLLLLGPNVVNVFAKVNNSLSAEGGGLLVNVALTPTVVAVTWTTCASENGVCSFSGTAQVRYGAGSSWNTGTFTNGVACNNSVFGDPAFGVVKSCQVGQ